MEAKWHLQLSVEVDSLLIMLLVLHYQNELTKNCKLVLSMTYGSTMYLALGLSHLGLEVLIKWNLLSSGQFLFWEFY